MSGLGSGEFNPELSDVFSLGLSFLRISLRLNEGGISGLNNSNS